MTINVSVSGPVLESVTVISIVKVFGPSKSPPFTSAKLIAPVTESITNVSESTPPVIS